MDPSLHNPLRDAAANGDTCARVSLYLWALGKTADEVAVSLLRRGHRGERSSNGTCPVARYLRSRFHAKEVEVLRTAIYVAGNRCEPTNAVAQFISQFDTGWHTELWSEDERARELELMAAGQKILQVVDR